MCSGPATSATLLGVPARIPPGVARQVARFDRSVDRAFDRLRGQPFADRLFYGASAAGEHGLIWVGLGAVRALRGGTHVRAGRRIVIGIAIESILVNGGIKSLFRRRRPEVDTPRPLPLRIPITSSFPSGHASAAFFGAALLSDGDAALAPLYYGTAVVVAASRVYVKIHHASDVVGGAIVGAGLGRLAKRIAPLEPASARTGESAQGAER
jgi:undecaprenyl-diphosphatase